MAREANIFILVDALGWEWIKLHHFLSSVAPYRRPLETVFGFSTAAIPSLLTGRYPDEHGRLALFHLAKNDSPFKALKWLCAMPPRIAENRYVRHLVERAVRKLAGFDGYFQLHRVPLRYLPLLDVCEKHDIYQPGGIAGSTSIFDLLSERNHPYSVYCYHHGPDARLLELMEGDLRKAETDFYFLYLAGLDAFLHAHADKPSAAGRCLDRYSESLTRLCQIARSAYRRVRVHVFGDHGMAPTRNSVDLQGKLDRLIARPAKDYLFLLDSTMARFWFFSPAARAEIMSRLYGAGGQWLSEQSLRSTRAWFDDRRYGEEIYLMPEATVIAPSHIGSIAARGMHGFHPSTAHSRAAFLSSEDYGSRVNHITDVFGLMRDGC